jgi:RNA polymerase sigma factor (sigma-70 family)
MTAEPSDRESLPPAMPGASSSSADGGGPTGTRILGEPMTSPVDPSETLRIEDLDDAALVERAQQRDGAAFWLIIKRHNQRLHRVARAVLNEDTEAEDVVQETYIHAFMRLSEFRAEARLSTWLTRIALNEALSRRRQRRSTVDLKAIEAMPAPFSAHEPDPEQAATLNDIRRLLERAVAGLPERYRIVFVMRDVEEMSIEETALLLGLRPQTVSTRVHRARRLLRQELQDKLASVFTDTFLFAGAPCDRLTQAVLDRLAVHLRKMQSQ